MGTKRSHELQSLDPNLRSTGVAGWLKQKPGKHTVERLDSGREIICLDSDDERPAKAQKTKHTNAHAKVSHKVKRDDSLMSKSMLGNFIPAASVNAWSTSATGFDDDDEIEIVHARPIAKPTQDSIGSKSTTADDMLMNSLFGSKSRQKQLPAKGTKVVSDYFAPKAEKARQQHLASQNAHQSHDDSHAPESRSFAQLARENMYSSGQEPVLDPYASQTAYGSHYGDLAAPAVQPMTEPELCPEQRALVDLIVRGRNVFYTGSAGCGKSTVLKAFVNDLNDMGKNVRIIAPTGRAALDIGGTTFWTYAGWTPLHMKKPLKQIVAGGHGKWVRKRLAETDVLVMDEVSMVENHHFERLNKLMKEARGDDRAFGGVQLVVTGDFCQLPPVKPFAHCIDCGRENLKTVDGNYKCPQHGVYKDADKWAFRSSAWQECMFEHVCLRTIHRQSDRTFIDILEKCRMGKGLTSSESDLLLNHETNFDNGVKLFATREEVRRINQAEFERLKSQKRTYKCLDVFTPHEQLPAWLSEKYSRRLPDGSLDQLRDHKFDPQIELKEGMLVVLIVNLDITAGLVNGSQGQLVGWESYDPVKLPKAKEKDNGRKPIVNSMGTLLGDHAAHRETCIRSFIDSAREKLWPVVQFDNGCKRTIFADCTINEVGDEKPYNLLSRTQIPLLSAWALSIHKSQGMTLTRVSVDLSRSFEEGQMYVALSRARSLEGLRVENLGRCLMKGNKQVMEFLLEKFNLK